MTINLYEIRLKETIINNSSLLDAFFLDCQCVLLLIDITNKNSLISILSLLNNINEEKYPHLKKILVENKSDLNNKIPIEEINKVKNYNQNKSIEHIKISTKNGNNIDELLLKIYNFINSENNSSILANRVKKYQSDIISKFQGEIKDNISLILVGDGGVGKTNFMLRYTKNIFETNSLITTGINSDTKIIQLDDKDNYKITLWDTAGQERYRSLPRKYYKNVDGILIFFDINSKKSFEGIYNWMKEIKEFCDKYDENDENNMVNIYLIGNKIDLYEKEYKKGFVENEDKEELTNNLHVKYFEISCKWNLNVDEIMAHMIIECSKNIVHKNNGVKLIKSSTIGNKNNKSKEGGCCGGQKEGKNSNKK